MSWELTPGCPELVPGCPGRRPSTGCIPVDAPKLGEPSVAVILMPAQ